MRETIANKQILYVSTASFFHFDFSTLSGAFTIFSHFEYALKFVTRITILKNIYSYITFQKIKKNNTDSEFRPTNFRSCSSWEHNLYIY